MALDDKTLFRVMRNGGLTRQVAQAIIEKPQTYGPFRITHDLAADYASASDLLEIPAGAFIAYSWYHVITPFVADVDDLAQLVVSDSSNETQRQYGPYSSDQVSNSPWFPQAPLRAYLSSSSPQTFTAGAIDFYMLVIHAPQK